LTERYAVVDRSELEAAALQHGMGRIDLAAVRKAMAAAEQRGRLIPAEKTDWHHAQGAFTTDEMVRLQKDNLAIRRAGIGQAEPIATVQQVRKWALDKGLSKEQTNAAILALASHDWMNAIEGLAGTAKTYTVGAIREFAEQHGYTVRAFGMTSGSVKQLKRVGLDARTVATLAAKPVPKSTRPQLWIVDESSQLASRPVNEILKIAEREGVALIRVVGDQRQHLGIEAGNPIDQFLADGMPVAELTEIKRQRDAALRLAVIQASQGRPGAAAHAIDLLDQQQRLNEIPDVKERYRRIAANYLKAHEAGQQTLVVSPGNDERREINRTIREALIESGHVKAGGYVHDILVPRQEMTKAAIAEARHYNAGDVIHFEREHKRQGIAKDAYLTVQSVDRKAHLLTLAYPNGRTIEAAPARWGNGVQVYTREQREISIGDRLEYRIHDRKNDVANHELATVMRFDGKEATLQFDDGRVVNGPLSPHLDLGYCSTSFGSQGSTVDTVIANLDSMRSARLVNQRALYVILSRARDDAQIYTDDSQALRNAVRREQRKEHALELVKQQPDQSLTQSVAIRI
jgi:ATP-dependent exoDNAse (exonuclease V) alpha subunit